MCVIIFVLVSKAEQVSQIRNWVLVAFRYFLIWVSSFLNMAFVSSEKPDKSTEETKYRKAWHKMRQVRELQEILPSCIHRNIQNDLKNHR